MTSWGDSVRSHRLVTEEWEEGVIPSGQGYGVSARSLRPEVGERESVQMV